jgi:hypothetical protein
MPVGDVNSNAVGSGARFNDGKAPLELVPSHILVLLFNGKRYYTHVVQKCLWATACFTTGRYDEFRATLSDLGDLLEPAARVFDYGSRKYAAWNWAKGMPWSVPVGCIHRHLVALVLAEEVNDEESGLSHLGHVMCNLIMLAHYLVYYPEGNDLPDPSVHYRISGPALFGNPSSEWAEESEYAALLELRQGRQDCDGI